ncbi:MAG TPA: flagella basal body P-ring formation protein FlgA [Spirochaetota bacterium]|nr:flagella basal body P-ring formation protein FlgA [Spirochaetota bacterium]HPI90309.1 flagella basal body P-ring formation protein FlgA [Spirochaetota bacterium]HPR49731.1 flagella basal body P-ring formation protein FlgA [Spirochaetota bacterium]
MKFCRIITAFIVITAMPARGAVISIYLHPQVTGSERLCLRDLADVEGDKEIAETLARTEIGRDLFSDGYIDRGELLRLLSGVEGAAVCIYGSAVRVTGPAAPENTGADLVRTGKPVTIIVTKNSLRVRFSGTALQSGSLGDPVRVRSGNNTVLEARVVSRDTVEKSL